MLEPAFKYKSLAILKGESNLAATGCGRERRRGEFRKRYACAVALSYSLRNAATFELASIARK